MDSPTLLNFLCKASHCSDTIELIESDKSATLRKVYIAGVPTGSLLIQIDNSVSFRNFLKPKLNDRCGYNKHCDYLILTDDLLIFIELKSYTELCETKLAEVSDKFFSDVCALKYSDIIFELMLKKRPIFDRKKQIHVLLYQDGPIPKKSDSRYIGMTGEFVVTTPDTFKKIAIKNEGKLFFKQLLY